MRIRKIIIKHFRAFRGTYTIDLHRAGHNLVVYGENGSGKTSLFHALDQFFQPSSKKPDFLSQKNIFISDDTNLKDEDKEGFVKLEIGTADEASIPYEWIETPDPLDQELIVEAAKTKGFIDYKSLLSTSYLHQGSETVDVFNLLVYTLLANVPNPVTATPFGDEWSQIELLPLGQFSKSVRERLTKALENFNAGLLVTVNQLMEKANEILASFEQGVTISLLPQQVDFETKPRKAFTNRHVWLQVTYYERNIEHHHLFLNEARLSAIGLSVFLASLLLNPAGRLKVLALDDVLIGLDMSNRLPLIDVLRRHFPDWQIILITYDRTWYEIIRQRTQGIGWNWESAEFYCGKTDAFEFPVYKAGKNFLDRAQEHLDQNDLKAAVIYLRTAYEQILKGFCEKMRLKICYSEDSKGYKSNDFWDGIKNGVKRDGTRYLDPEFTREVEIYRNFILNPLSHEATISPIKREVEGAITKIRELKRCLEDVVASERPARAPATEE